MKTATHADPIAALRTAEDQNGQVSYGLASAVAGCYGLTDTFLAEYGLPGNWQDPEFGSFGVDVGELIAWIEVN